MKENYENRQRFYLTRRMPVIIRVDGRAFHTFTRRFEKPFSLTLIDAMRLSAKTLAREMQGFKLAYVQSDEASFVLTDYDNLNTEGWFNYNKSKIESISASIMTAAFNQYLTGPAYFDARAFNIPESEVVNYFLWRAKDWYRNSVSMYAQAHFSHKELHGKSVADMHELLHTIDLNWAVACSEVERNGTFITDEFLTNIRPQYIEIENLWKKSLGITQE